MKTKRTNKYFKHLVTALCAGTVGIAGTSVILMNRPTNNSGNPVNQDVNETKINLSVFDGKVSEKLSNAANAGQLLRAFLATNNGITKYDDLIVTDIDPVNRTFKVTTQNNSYYYVAESFATCGWDLPTISTDWTEVTGTNKLTSRLFVYDDTEIERNAILKDLAEQYPLLDVNQLYIDTNALDQESKSAEIRVVENSVIYDSTIRGTITAGFNASIELSYANSTLNQSTLTATPTFKFKGNPAIVPTYEITPSVANPLAWTSTTGVLKLTVGTEFAGGLYTVTATHVDNGNTYTARAFIYVQPFYPFADLYISCNKTVINQSNQTATFTLKNGSANPTTGVTWGISPSADSTLTWTGADVSNTATLKITTLNVTIPAGSYVITATIGGHSARYSISVQAFAPAIYMPSPFSLGTERCLAFTTTCDDFGTGIHTNSFENGNQLNGAVVMRLDSTVNNQGPNVDWMYISTVNNGWTSTALNVTFKNLRTGLNISGQVYQKRLILNRTGANVWNVGDYVYATCYLSPITYGAPVRVN